MEYLDQNALIALGRKARTSEFREKLDDALEGGALSVVVSPWHLIETAHSTNLGMAIELAEFIDSLKPAWILERHDILKLEVQEDFYRFLGLDYTSKPRVTTRSAAFAALNNCKDSPRFDIPSVQFVRQWIEHPEQVKSLKKTYEDNANSLIPESGAFSPSRGAAEALLTAS
jgi:hypothetical protein